MAPTKNAPGSPDGDRPGRLPTVTIHHSRQHERPAGQWPGIDGPDRHLPPAGWPRRPRASFRFLHRPRRPDRPGPGVEQTCHGDDQYDPEGDLLDRRVGRIVQEGEVLELFLSLCCRGGSRSGGTVRGIGRRRCLASAGAFLVIASAGGCVFSAAAVGAAAGAASFLAGSCARTQAGIPAAPA